MARADPTDQPLSICPNCGAGLRCGVVTGDAKCWCFDFARVIAVPLAGKEKNATCLCPACLQELIASQTHKQ